MKLAIRSTPYFQWLVESRTGRKRKVLGRFGDERNAKQFLAGLTKGAGAQVLSSQTPNGHRARAGATPASSSNSLGSSKVEPTLYKGQVAGSTPALATVLPTVSLLLTAIACCAVSVCAADGGHSLSAGFSCTLEQRHGQRGGMVADNGCPLSSGSSPDVPRSAGPADSFSVAAWIDTQRPHSTEPWLSPDSEGAQSERAVSQGRLDPPGQISPTEFNVHPSSGFSRPASGLAWDDGVGNGSTRVSDTARPQPNAGGGFNFRGAFAYLTVLGSALAGLAVMTSCAKAGSLEDPR